jgi:hypothetical protein
MNKKMQMKINERLFIRSTDHAVKLQYHLKKYSAALSAIILALAVLTASPAFSEHNNPINQGGPHFTDSSETIQMPEEWLKKSITYEPQNSGADVVISLDGQMYHAWEPIIKKYAEENNLKIVITRGTCGFSAGGLSRKVIDIGAFCCPPGKTDRLPGLRYYTTGIAALALLVNKDNPVDNISLEQARHIFQGEIQRWSDIDGNINNDSLINPVARLHCKLRPGHWRLLLDNENLFSPDLYEVGAMPDMISQVSGDKDSIGYETLWMTRHYDNENNVKFLRVNGYSPDMPADVISMRYSLYRVYNLTVWEDEHLANPDSQKLIKHLLQEAERLDSKFHFIPSSKLKKAGWKFRNGELVGTP